jgi:hypothetical protein
MFGGAEGDRTPDLRIANATLSQLSYGPIHALTPEKREMRRDNGRSRRFLSREARREVRA